MSAIAVPQAAERSEPLPAIAVSKLTSSVERRSSAGT